jgi:hypothetical protein
MPDSNDLKNLDSQLKKTLLSAESFKKGSSVDVSKSILKIQKTFTSLIDSVRQLVTSVVSIKKIVDNNSLKINSLKNISKIQKIRITGESIGSKLLVPPAVKGVTPPVLPAVKGVTPPVTPAVKGVTPPVTPAVKGVTPPVTPAVKGVTPPVPPAVKGVTPPVPPAVIGTPPVPPAVKGVTPPVTPAVIGTPPVPPAVIGTPPVPPAVIGTPPVTPAVIGTPPVPPVSGSVPKLIDDLKKLNIKVIDIEKIVNNNSRKITSLKNISKTQSTRISGENIGAKLPGSSASNVEDSITKIAASVASIAAILAGRQKALDNAAAFDRRKAEQEKRRLAEANLEKKFEGLKSAAEKVIAPVKSILDRIIDFFVTVFLGRVVYKLLEWFGDKKNADKVKSIGRFLKDFGPAILTAFVLFGTSFGRLTLGLTKMIGGFIFKIGKVLIPQLLKLIARHPKAALAVGLLTAGATIPAMFPGTVDEQEKKTKSKPGSTEDKIKALEQQKTNLNPLQKMQGVGSEIDEQLSTLKTGQTKSYGFSGGGFNFKGMLGGGGLGAMLGPLGMLLGGALGSGKPQEMFGGFVSGEKGVDKVPAMLSDGEFVMSAGAVQKYGVDTLEGMNAAGGGTNKPKMISGTTYAAGGGMIGDEREKVRDPILEKRDKLITSLNNYGSAITTGGREKGGDLLNAIKNLSSTLSGGSVGQSSGSGGGQGGTGQSSSSPRGSTSTGSLLTDPLGAAKRIMGIKDSKPSSSKPSSPKPPASKSGTPGFFEEIAQKLTGPGASTYLDAGTIYAKQMLGGFDGPVSERNLGKDSKAELQKAIQRAKKRTGSEMAKAEAKIAQLRAMGAKDGNSALETQKSFLKKLKAGGIRVQYTDYADEKGKMSASAENAKNILGQFWAYGRDKEEGGGYRVEDKYDFDPLKKKVKDPKTGKMVDKDLDMGELVRDKMFGRNVPFKERLQAAFLLNPLKGKGDVDMVLGGKRTAEEEMGLTGSKTLLGGLLGMSGKPKEKNTKAQIPKSKPKNVRGGGVKPSTPPKPTVIYGPPAPQKRNRPGSGASTKTPSFSASNPNGHRSKQETLGLMR